MNLLSRLREALKDQLTNINTANGYRTNAGNNVRTGWFSEVIDAESASFPVIVIQRGKNGPPDTASGELVVSPGYYIIAAVDVGLDDYDDALDELEMDLWKAIKPESYRRVSWAPFGICQMQIGAPEHVAPGDGLKAASLVIPIQFKMIVSSDDEQNIR